MADRSHALLTLDDLEEGQNVFSLELRSEDLELKDEFFTFHSLVKAEVEVRRSLDNFNLEGVVSCKIAGDCYRCLKAAELAV